MRNETEEIKSKKIQFGIWSALTREARRSAGLPELQKDLAERLGLVEETLARWQKDATVKLARQSASNLFLGVSDLSVMQDIRSKAESGVYRYQRLFCELRELTSQPPKPSSPKVSITLVRAKRVNGELVEGKKSVQKPTFATAYTIGNPLSK